MAVLAGACVPPDKNVGNEMDGSADGGDSADDGMDDGVDDGVDDGGTPTACADATDEASCTAAGAAMGPGNSCGWVQVSQIAAGDDFCGFGNETGRCLDLTYQGDGCGMFPDCTGEVQNATTYYQNLGGENYEVFTAPFCEFQPSWSACIWDDAGQLSSGPPACSCVCGGGGGAELPPDWHEALTMQTGCLDMVLFARNPTDQFGMVLRIDQELVGQQKLSGAPLDVTIDAVDADSLRLLVGTDVTGDQCTDALEGDPPVHTTTWNATGGTITIHIEGSPPSNPLATVTLTAIEFTPDTGGGSVELLPSYEFTAVGVGGVPG